MSTRYNEYLTRHKDGVSKAFEWINSNIHSLIQPIENEVRDQIAVHDESKFSNEEYDAYDKYFYGGNRSYEVRNEFDKAWLHHIHNNPHHWQYWVLLKDDGDIEVLDMPTNYIIEMICDWWSFSWNDGDLFEIFNWYGANKDIIKLSTWTKITVENILDMMKTILEANNE